MQPGKDYVEVRHGTIQAGDFVHLPALATYVEVAADSVFIGADVSTQKRVVRHLRHVAGKPLSFEKPTDRADYLREMDSVDLVNENHDKRFRVVVYKDAEFVYLRKVLTEKACSNTGSKVCRKTGKVWEWDGLGWTLQEGWSLRIPGEQDPAGYATGGLVGQPLVVDEKVFMGD